MNDRIGSSGRGASSGVDRGFEEKDPPTRAHSLDEDFNELPQSESAKELLKKINQALHPEVKGLEAEDREGLKKIKQLLEKGAASALLPDYAELVHEHTRNISESPPPTAPQSPLATAAKKKPATAPQTHLTYAEKLASHQKQGFDKPLVGNRLADGRVQDFEQKSSPIERISTIQERAQKLTFMAKNQNGLEVRSGDDFAQYNSLSPIAKVVNNIRRKVESYRQDTSISERHGTLARIEYSDSVNRMADKLFYATSESPELLAKELLIALTTLDWSVQPEHVLLRKLKEEDMKNLEGLTAEQLSQVIDSVKKMTQQFEARTKLLTDQGKTIHSDPDLMVLSNMRLASSILLRDVSNISIE